MSIMVANFTPFSDLCGNLGVNGVGSESVLCYKEWNFVFWAEANKAGMLRAAGKRLYKTGCRLQALTWHVKDVLEQIIVIIRLAYWSVSPNLTKKNCLQIFGQEGAKTWFKYSKINKIFSSQILLYSGIYHHHIGRWKVGQLIKFATGCFKKTWENWCLNFVVRNLCVSVSVCKMYILFLKL